MTSPDLRESIPWCSEERFGHRGVVVGSEFLSKLGGEILLIHIAPYTLKVMFYLLLWRFNLQLEKRVFEHYMLDQASSPSSSGRSNPSILLRTWRVNDLDDGMTSAKIESAIDL